MHRSAVVILGLLAAGLSLWACGDDDSSPAVVGQGGSDAGADLDSAAKGGAAGTSGKGGTAGAGGLGKGGAAGGVGGGGSNTGGAGSGGAAASGGSSGTGGTAASGGSSGTGGTTAQGGSAGGGTGGSAGGPSSTDCSLANVLCVDDTPGPQQEYTTIQAAADATKAGDTVVVWDGTYAGFQVDTSGSAGVPVYYYAVSNQVLINQPTGTGDGIRLQNVSYVTLDGFHVQGVPQRCIAARGATPEVPMNGLVIRRNRCDQAGVEGFYLSEVSHSLIENNEVASAGVSGDSRSHCVYLANAGSDGTTIRGNILHGCNFSESNGIHFNGDLSVGGDGIIQDLVVEGNIIYDSGQNGLNMDGVQNSVIQNNIIFGHARNALRAYAIDAAEGPKNLRIVNNTLLATTSGWGLKFSEDLGGHVVFNNILFGVEGAISQDASPGFQSDYNVLDDHLSADGEDTIVSLAAWQGLGFDAHSLVSTSADLFLAPGANDYHLKAGAPAVDKGTASFAGVGAPLIDVFGTQRPQGTAIDIGADEF